MATRQITVYKLKANLNYQTLDTKVHLQTSQWFNLDKSDFKLQRYND